MSIATSPEGASLQSAAAAAPVASPAPGRTAGAPEGGAIRRTGSRIRKAVWTFRREILWVAFFSAIANLMMLTPTLYMLQVFDRVLLSGNSDTLVALTLIAVLLFVVMGFAEWLRSRLLVRAGALLDEKLHARLFNANFLAWCAGRVSNPTQAFADLAALRQFITGPGAFALFDLPWIPVYLALLFVMHPMLGWSAIAFALVTLVAALLGSRYSTPRNEQALKTVVQMNGYLHAKLRNAETVEALGMLPSLRRRWLDVHGKEMALHEAAHDANHRVQALMKFLQFTQQSLMLSVGALLAIDGKIGVGAMIAANTLMGAALRPIGTITSTWRAFIDARQCHERLERVFDNEPAEGGSRHAGAFSGQVTLRGLRATASGRQQPILDGLDAEFKAGEVVAVVGPSGAGKSTLVRCLVGAWAQHSGQVLYDGRPLAEWDPDALGPQVGYLPQDIEMLDGTVAENIARMGPVDSDRVIEAARRTGIHDLVLRLPRGYDTPMGELGSLLSGGQRQRIGLARAVYGNPRLVVLDEPNASLDEAGDAALIQTIRQLKQSGSTVFMVVHQKHYLAVADRLLVLDKGRIVQLAQIIIETRTANAEAKS